MLPEMETLLDLGAQSEEYFFDEDPSQQSKSAAIFKLQAQS